MEKTTSEHEVAAALRSCGWRLDDPANAVYSYPGHRIQLHRITEHAGWDCYFLESPALQLPEPQQIPEANHRLGGPLKWVLDGSRRPRCRADLPKHWPSVQDASRPDLHLAGGTGPLHAWAAAVTGLALGRSPAEEIPALSVADLAQVLERAGWVASVDEGQLRVHVHMPGLYRAIRVDRFGPADWRVGASVTPWSGLGKLPRRAIRVCASAADRRLPLVRLAVMSEGSVAELRAEVALPSSGACVPGEWVITAVEAVHLAVSLCARETLALRDTALAKLVLAGVSAGPVVKGGL